MSNIKDFFNSASTGNSNNNNYIKGYPLYKKPINTNSAIGLQDNSGNFIRQNSNYIYYEKGYSMAGDTKNIIRYFYNLSKKRKPNMIKKMEEYNI